MFRLFPVALVLICLFPNELLATSTMLTDELPSMFGGRIKHVIVIMFENRSMDHFLGHLVTINDKIDGCSPDIPQCKNPISPSDPNSAEISVGFDAVYVQPGGPNHKINGTTDQLYSSTNNNIHYYPALMNGFIHSYKERDTLPNDNGTFIMQCFNQTSLPILSTLAQDFGVFNSWFAAVPGPTEPNRVYSWMATSQGLGNDNRDRLEKGFIGPNIFEMFDRYWDYTNISSRDKWRLYWETFPTPIFVEYTRLHPENGRFMDEFYKDVKNGDLPLFTWLDPNYAHMTGFDASDQHPDHDVREGERLMKRIYETVRNSSIWNDTLFLIFYDEHGGFYDHVSPSFAPNPDGINATYEYGGPFDFQRIGLRIPSVMISPWIPKGFIVEPPQQNEYYNASQYTHSSLIHTLREQYTPKSPPLTKRDEWSKTFEDVLMQLNEPRTDCPMTLPKVPKSNVNIPIDNINNSFQSGLLYAVSSLCNMEKDVIDDLVTKDSDTYGPILMECVRQWQTGEVVYVPKIH